MSRFVDLFHQVTGTLQKARGGTGNRHGYSTAVVEAHANWSTTVTIPVGTIVMLKGLTVVAPVDAADSENVYGVVIGYYRQSDGALLADAVPAGGLAAVMIRGRCKALADTDLNDGDYAYSSGTDGYGYGQVTIETGAFGRWLSDGDVSELDLIPIEVGLIGGGGGGGPAASFTDAQVEATFILPAAGTEVVTRVPWDFTCTGYAIVGDDAGGSAVVDVWADDDAAWRPTVLDTITAADLPTLVTDDHDTGVCTGWTTALTKGDWLVFHVNSVTLHQALTVAIFGDRAT